MAMYDVRTEFFLTEFIFDRLKTFSLSTTAVIIFTMHRCGILYNTQVLGFAKHLFCLDLR